MIRHQYAKYSTEAIEGNQSSLEENEVSIFNKKEKTAEEHQWSREADQTRFLYLMFILAIITLLGLFGLEIWHPNDGDKTILFFTPEITHIIVNGVLLGFIGLGSYIYGKAAGANEAISKLVGQNGGNGSNHNNQEKKQ